jgi:ligand-binding sensor domain-containing protein
VEASGSPSEPRAILPDPTQPFRLYAIDAVTGFSVSSDRGDTWVAANGGLTDPFVTAAAVDPLLGSVVYAATPTGVFRTDTAGESWELTSLRLPATAFAFDTSSPGVVYAGTDAGVFRTSDGGANWIPLSGLTGILTLAVDPERGHLYAGTASGVFELDLRARSPRTLEAR